MRINFSLHSCIARPWCENIVVKSKFGTFFFLISYRVIKRTSLIHYLIVTTFHSLGTTHELQEYSHHRWSCQDIVTIDR